MSQNNSSYPHKLKEGLRIVGIINFSGPLDDFYQLREKFINSNNPTSIQIGLAFFPETDKTEIEKVIAIYSPMSYLKQNKTPYFLLRGGQDEQINPDSYLEFTKLLESSSFKNEILVYPQGGHFWNIEDIEYSFLEIFEFLNSL